VNHVDELFDRFTYFVNRYTKRVVALSHVLKGWSDHASADTTKCRFKVRKSTCERFVRLACLCAERFVHSFGKVRELYLTFRHHVTKFGLCHTEVFGQSGSRVKASERKLIQLGGHQSTLTCYCGED